MKKIRLSMMAAALVLATGANAGVAGVNFGIGGGQFSTDNPAGSYTDSTGFSPITLDLETTLNLEGADNTYAWAYIEHPLPVIPNIRFEMNSERYEGLSTLNQTFYGQTFSSDVNSVADISSNDVVLYWGLPLTGVASTVTPGVDFDVDFGVGAKMFDGEMTITSTDAAATTGELIEEVIPYGYARGRVEAFGAGLEGQIKYVSYDVNEYTDFSVKVDYTFPVTPVIDLGVEAGYKQTDLVVDVNGLQADLSASGYFVGVFAKF